MTNLNDEGRSAPDLLAQGSDIGSAVPLTLDRIDTSTEQYGVKVSTIGIDGDAGWVAFTHDARRAIAALHRYIRDDLNSGPVREVRVVSQPTWWLVVDNCGCGEACPHPPEWDGSADHDCANYGLPPCTDELAGWIGSECVAGTPGSVPVLELEADY